MRNENDFEQTLKSLTPLPAKIDPISAAFAAGHNSSRSQTRRWQATTFAALLLCGITWLTRPATPPHAVPLEITVASTPTDPTPPLSDGSELKMERAVLARGIDGLPPWHSMTIIQADPTGSL